MKLDINIAPEFAGDPELRRGIDAMNEVLHQRAERYAKRFPEDLPSTLKIEWVPSPTDERYMLVRLTDGDDVMEDRFAVEDIRVGVGRGRVDPALWVFKIWDMFLGYQVRRSLERV